MPARFLSGQVRLLVKRCCKLRESLCSLTSLPVELQSRKGELDSLLSDIADGLEKLLADPDFGAPQLLKNHLDDYKRFAELVDVLESHPLALLDHYNDKDHHLFRFAYLFCQQTGYPYTSPFLCAHSNQYFYSMPATNLIGLPLCEGQFLLALPDFAHELGHIFFSHNRDWLRGPFGDAVRRYISGEKRRVADESQAEAYQRHFDLLERAWLQWYGIEFACDMFATYLIGPAFGWSHWRLVIASRTNLYHPTFGKVERHPADEARMRGILHMLRELNDPSSEKAISHKWDEFKSVVGDTPEAEYEYCYPDPLLLELVRHTIAVMTNRGLIPYSHQPQNDENLVATMQEAWKQFHADPSRYADWEAERIAEVNAVLAAIQATKALVLNREDCS